MSGKSQEALIKSGAQIAQQIFRQIVQIECRWADAHQAKFVRYDEKYASKMRAKPSGVI